METKNAKITIKDVSRVFCSPSGERIDALKDVNLEVEDAFSPAGRDIGEFRVLLGPSGCGKSTLLRMVAGLDQPDRGEVLVNGDRKSTRLNSSHLGISYAVFCLKKKKQQIIIYD